MKRVILTFDDCPKSHLTVAADELQKRDMSATFFICRFCPEWRAEHEDTLLTPEELKKLWQMGFEIGNHTFDHRCLHENSEEYAFEQIGKMNDFLAGVGVPKPEVFAYPGGPYAPTAQKALEAAGFIGARVVEERAFNHLKDEKMRIPSFSVRGEDDSSFFAALNVLDEALARGESEAAAVLVYHGVPETVHPWVHTPEAAFRRQMAFLADNGYHTYSMGGFLHEFPIVKN